MRIFKRGVSLWQSERSYLVFFFFLIFSNFIVAPLYEGSETGRIILKSFFLFIVISGTLVYARSRIFQWIVVFVGCLDFIFYTYSLSHDTSLSEFVGDIFQLFFYTTFLGLLLMKVFGDKSENYHRVIGAVTAYVMLGSLFAVAYHLLYLIYGEGVFNFPDLQEGRGLLHFSYCTLTTVGYGDIIPIHPFARSLSNVEALIGQLYPAILIARLITPANKN